MQHVCLLKAESIIAMEKSCINKEGRSCVECIHLAIIVEGELDISMTSLAKPTAIRKKVVGVPFLRPDSREAFSISSWAVDMSILMNFVHFPNSSRCITKEGGSCLDCTHISLTLECELGIIMTSLGKHTDGVGVPVLRPDSMED